MRTAPLALSFLLAAGPGFAQDFTFHMPEGAQMVLQATDDYARVTFPVGPAVDGIVPQDHQDGRVQTSVVQFPAKMSLDAVMAGVRSQLAREDQELLLDCTSRTCGGFDFRQVVETVPPPDMIVDLAMFGYLAARDRRSGRVEIVLVSLASGTGYLQHVGIMPASAPGLAAPTAVAPLPSATPPPEEGLFADRGTIVLEGLVFETGSAALSDTDHPELQKLAEFLESNPGARVVLVGHTDAEGGLAPNIALSRQRAGAVRNRLIDGFGVDPDQLLTDGVGYLAPRATNTTREGRLRNRRVEAVLMAP